MSLKVLLIGMPGSGKGTQARRLVPLGFAHISTGELIRDAQARGDPVLMPYKEQMDRGELLPDKEIFRLVNRELEKIGDSNYALDGAIRNRAQAETALQRGLVSHALYLFLNEEEARKRMAKRYEIEGRKDDAPDAINKRLLKYKEETEPVINYFLDRLVPLYMINAFPSPDEVHQEVLRVLRIK